MLHSWADGTVKKYIGVFKRWKRWALAHKLQPIPARPHEFVLYLQYIGEQSASKSAAEEACNALAWIHSTSGLASPSTHPLVKVALGGLQRTLAKPVVKKEPLTIEMVEAMLTDADQLGSLSDMRLATTCLLGYAAFLRFSELVELRPCDFSIVGDVKTIHILHSKNDQLRQGDDVVLARTRSKTCPVSRLESYLHRVEMTLRDERFLFWAILKTKNGKKL